MKVLLLLTTSVLAGSAACAQTMVETAVLSGAASSASGAASGVGGALAKSLGRIEGSLSGKPAGAARARSGSVPAEAVVDRRPAPPPPPKPAKSVLEAVQPGLERSELIAKAGKPSFAIVSSEEETMSFICKEGDAYTVKVVEGKVASITLK
jgi:hypothetical protein